MTERDWMDKALALAKENEEKNGGAPFGAVVVKDGQLIGTGVNEVSMTNDPTMHAEIQAVRKACETLQTTDLTGCDIFASTEPCPMCLSALYFTNIQAVYFATPSNPSQDYVYNQLSLNREKRSIPMVQIPQ